MNTRILFAVVVSMFVCQQVHTPAQDDPEAEVTELEGTWELVSLVVEGEQRDVADGLLCRFEGNIKVPMAPVLSRTVISGNPSQS